MRVCVCVRVCFFLARTRCCTLCQCKRTYYANTPARNEENCAKEAHIQLTDTPLSHHIHSSKLGAVAAAPFRDYIINTHRSIKCPDEQVTRRRTYSRRCASFICSLCVSRSVRAQSLATLSQIVVCKCASRQMPMRVSFTFVKVCTHMIHVHK